MKRIICCLDGTWNDNRAGSTLTNVGKLHQVIAASDSNGVRQISHYIEGIVSAEGESLQFLKGGIGVGVDDRIRKAYEALAKDYEPGDEIYLIGFSRGAFEARSLGGLITLFGVAKAGARSPSTRPGRSIARREKSATRRRWRSCGLPRTIRCASSASASGTPSATSATRSSRAARSAAGSSSTTRGCPRRSMSALHALSIDEVRGPFRPTLWTLPKGRVLPAHQHVEQVWFAGTHADIGGGHRETAALGHRPGVDGGAHPGHHRPRLGHGEARPHDAARSAGAAALRGGGLDLHLERPLALHPPGEAGDSGDPAAAAHVARQLAHGQARARRPVSVNESIHDSVLERFGERVIELRYGRSRTMTYRPRNLCRRDARASGRRRRKPDTGQAAAHQGFHCARHVRPRGRLGQLGPQADDAKKEQRAFVNRLAGHLKERGVVLEELDHTQYNWSGGNSHDERRVAAIGLKKLIQEELSKADDAARQGLLRQGVHRRPQPWRHDLAARHEPLGQGRRLLRPGQERADRRAQARRRVPDVPAHAQRHGRARIRCGGPTGSSPSAARSSRSKSDGVACSRPRSAYGCTASWRCCPDWACCTTSSSRAHG